MLGIFLRPGALLFARFLRHMSYVYLSNYSCSGVRGFPPLPKMSPSKSCHGYCPTPHMHFGMCSSWWVACWYYENIIDGLMGLNFIGYV